MLFLVKYPLRNCVFLIFLKLALWTCHFSGHLGSSFLQFLRFTDSTDLKDLNLNHKDHTDLKLLNTPINICVCWRQVWWDLTRTNHSSRYWWILISLCKAMTLSSLVTKVIFTSAVDKLENLIDKLNFYKIISYLVDQCICPARSRSRQTLEKNVLSWALTGTGSVLSIRQVFCRHPAPLLRVRAHAHFLFLWPT